MPNPSFWESYNQFFPPMSQFSFGDNFAANMLGSSATISGDNSPDINRVIATSGPERFPVADALRGLEIFGPGGGIATGPDLATIEDRSKPTRFNDFMNRLGLGSLALILVAAGILYLGLTVYAKTQGGTVSDVVTGAV